MRSFAGDRAGGAELAAWAAREKRPLPELLVEAVLRAARASAKRAQRALGRVEVAGCGGTYVRAGAPCLGCPDCDYVARAAARAGEVAP